MDRQYSTFQQNNSKQYFRLMLNWVQTFLVHSWNTSWFLSWLVSKFPANFGNPNPTTYRTLMGVRCEILEGYTQTTKATRYRERTLQTRQWMGREENTSSVISFWTSLKLCCIDSKVDPKQNFRSPRIATLSLCKEGWIMCDIWIFFYSTDTLFMCARQL